MTTATQRQPKSAPTIREALSSEGGRRMFDATFAWLKKRGVQEHLLAETKAILEQANWEMDYPLVLEIINAVEATSRFLSIDRRPRLVVTNQNERPHLRSK